MKIINLLLGKANPNKMNGVNIVVHNIATELMALKIDVEVWGLSNNLQVKHDHIYPLRVFKTNPFRFVLDEKLKNAIDLCPGNTIFHLHSVFLPELIAVSNYLNKRGVTWIHTPHGQYIPESLQNNWKKSIFMNLFEKKFIKNAAITHAIGVAEVTAIKKIHASQKIVLIPNGFTPCHTKDANYNRSELVFGYCGRLSIKQKGLDIFLEAFTLYKKNGGIGKIVIIGDGNDRIKLEKIAINLGIENFINFKGALFGDEKINQLKKFTFFVHTSRWDVIPTGVLEAAGLGIPLFITQETNLLEYVQKYDAGICIPKASVENILSSLDDANALFKNRKLDEVSIAAMKMVNDELNWSHIAKRYLNNMYLKVKI